VKLFDQSWQGKPGMSHSETPKSLGNLPTGLAFELPDLVLAQSWAEFHNLRMVIELDACIEGEEYEEVLAFYPAGSAFRRWMMWRSHVDIVVQPMMGHTQHYPTAADAFEQMIRAPA
jgi:hypothetical protein